jgi:hypothetical protein
MEEEGKITMTEFKTVVEGFHSEIKKIIEVMQHRFGVVDTKLEIVGKRLDKHDTQFVLIQQKFDKIDRRFDQVDQTMGDMQTDIHSIKEQGKLLHEGHVEIKAELKRKVSEDEFEKLEKRVARLESKVA